jgi:hypothetical protein
MKVCSKCKIKKTLCEFGILKSSSDGYNYCCKTCKNSYYVKKVKIFLEDNIKKCSTCSELKNKEYFSKNKNSKDGFKSSCKDCLNLKNRNYLKQNPEVSKKYRQDNKESIKSKNAEYYQKNKEKVKEKTKTWAKNNPEATKNSKKKYSDKNKKKIQIKNYEWEKNKRATDPQYKIMRNLRSLIGQSFSRILNGKLKRSKKSETLLDCNFEFFFSYISSQFTEGMSFNNYGEWELDHIKPIASAKNLKDVEDLNHYTNFRPLWRNNNRVKSKKIEQIQLKLI